MNNSDLVMIKLDRPRELRFDYTAMKTLVALTGKKVEELDDEGFNISDFEKLNIAVYCGLLKDARAHNETLSVEKVESLFDEAPHFSHVYESFVMAWKAAFGVKVEPFEGNQQEPVKQPAQEQPSTSRKAAK